MPQYGFTSLDVDDPGKGCDVCRKGKVYVTRLTWPDDPEAGRVAQVCKPCWESLLDLQHRGVLNIVARQAAVSADR